METVGSDVGEDPESILLRENLTDEFVTLLGEAQPFHRVMVTPVSVSTSAGRMWLHCAISALVTL